MRKLIHILLLFIYNHPHSSEAQEQKFKGRVVDELTNEAISGAKVSCIDNSIKTLSGHNGEFQFEHFCDSVHFFAEGYLPATFHPGPGVQEFRLYPLTFQFEPTYITSGPIEILKERKKFVYDYELYFDRLFLITKDPGKKIRTLKILDENGNELNSTKEIPEEPLALFRDCEERLFVLGEYFAYLISRGDNYFFSQDIPIDFFNDKIKPCTGKAGDLRFVSFRRDDQHLVYLPIHKSDGRIGNAIGIKDSFALRHIRDENLMASKGLGMGETPLDPQRSGFQGGLDERFRKLVICPPVFAPMVSHENGFRIFDHANGQINSYDDFGNQIFSVKFNYHKNLKWEPMIIPDRKSEKVYTIFNQNGYYTISEISLQSGEIKEICTLQHRFVTKIILSGNDLFYLYRDNNYDPVRRLYKMKIK